ncbi:MAG: TM0106 family RecB-like putative nuclease [Planctomycetota bacterium]
MKRTPRPITGTHLFQRERCRRFVWLEFHGDITKKAPPDAAAEVRLARGRAHEKEIIANLSVVEPKYPARDFAAGARETLKLMKAGENLIYQGVLTNDGRVGIPDLLRRAENGRYVVGDVKASNEPKIEHAMQVAFYSELLSKTLSEPPPDHGFLILANGAEAKINLNEISYLYQEAAADVEQIRNGAAEPRAAMNSHCGGCAWRNVCIPEMQTKRDLSLVYSITPARRAALESASIVNINDLAECEPAAVAEKTELPRETLRRLRLQAIALLQNKSQRLGALSWKPARIAVAAAIARDPRGTHYAEFMLYRTSKDKDRLEETWFHSEAREAKDEAVAYRKFIFALAGDRDAPIYHFGPGLPDAMAELDSRHGMLNDPVHGVFARLHDVQTSLRSALVLPAYHYDLTSVTNALGIPLPPLEAPNGTETDDALIVSLRRRAAEEVKAIRNIRVAAQRAWEAAGEMTTVKEVNTIHTAI